ncbi:MAG: TonB-dependent receptor [Mucilaginibacter sp.]|nr:TonB-dependent receptor [Mucilaginibacter sp.]
MGYRVAICAVTLKNYAAPEYRYSDSYFDNPQHFKRLNFFTKYKDKLSERSTLTLSASTLYSTWFASGQIPDQAIDKYGYNGSYFYEGYLGNTKVSTDIGINARLDVTDSSELSHTVNHYTLLNRIKLG